MSRGAHLSANATVSAHGADLLPHSDTQDVPVTRALYIGGTGNVHVTMADGQTVTFEAVPQGMILPIQISRLWTTNTTASYIIGLY